MTEFSCCLNSSIGSICFYCYCQLILDKSLYYPMLISTCLWKAITLPYHSFHPNYFLLTLSLNFHVSEILPSIREYQRKWLPRMTIISLDEISLWYIPLMPLVNQNNWLVENVILQGMSVGEWAGYTISGVDW